LTEALAASVPDRLVGATDWCTHPTDLDVTRVRGTKNPDIPSIVRLRPDLVVANQEENRRVDVERLRAAGIPVWVTVVESIDQALRTLHRLLVDLVGTDLPEWLATASREWSRRPPLPPVRVVIPIWREPWIVVGSRTFSGDVATRLGLVHVLAGSEHRYPKLDLSDLIALAPDLVLLPDEPYPFAVDDGPEAFAGKATVLLSGRDLTWYGPSMATSWQTLSLRIASTLNSR
jgi:ABC-type Fe3+-hydroxamate transport system substrate-binding protein